MYIDVPYLNFWQRFLVNEQIRDVSGTQLRSTISARSNFGLGFAQTHIVAEVASLIVEASTSDLTVADLYSHF
jgi:hypothetical protein